MFNQSLVFGESRNVGSKWPCYVIAEAGVSHFGDIGLARELLWASVEAKADCFKIQIFDIDELFSDHLPSWKDRLRPRNLTFDEVSQLREMCKGAGIHFAATAHDPSRLAWLNELDVAFFKIGSGECGNLSFIRSILELGKPVVLSTGMYSTQDVLAVIHCAKSVGNYDLALLHCVTAYPTPEDEVNLLSLNALREIFDGVVGYSDHTSTNVAILGAVALRSSIIERHITLEKNIPNAQDWKVSSYPSELIELVKNIRSLEKMMGQPDIFRSSSEVEAEKWALKSIVYSDDLSEGTVLRECHIKYKRAGAVVLRPDQNDKIIGRKLTVAVAKDELVNEVHFR